MLFKIIHSRKLLKRAEKSFITIQFLDIKVIQLCNLIMTATLSFCYAHKLKN